MATEIEKAKNPVIAIGLDSAEPSLVEKWMSQGYLPNLHRLRQQGIYGRLENFEACNVETSWTTFATGCRPEKTGYWAQIKLREGTYQVETRAAYEYDEYSPFYALGKEYRVAAFDVPHVRLTDKINGLQVAAWGAHSPQVNRGSLPNSLFQEIVDRYGVHPGFGRDFALCLNLKTALEIEQRLLTGIARASAICQDLLQRSPWDLFITSFGETHSGSHNYWQLSQPDHPLYEVLSQQVAHDPLLAIFQAIDRAIGEIVAHAPDNASVVIFSLNGMGPSTTDLPNFAFLPEFLYRFSFPGKWGIAPGDLADVLPPRLTKMKWDYWERHLWADKCDRNAIRSFLRRETPTRLFNLIEPLLEFTQKSDLISPFKLTREGERVVPGNAAQWYRKIWPTMKAFALPSFGQGYIRINLEGREPKGIVAPSDYLALCEELSEKLYALKDARTGIPMVKEIIRTRKDPSDRDPKLHDADLIAIWQDEYATDIVESPDYGRFGPLPPLRAGGHRPDGFMLACGPAIEPGACLTKGHALDLAPTILHLMGAPIPDYLDGKTLLDGNLSIAGWP